jgi:geranylgeranyl pyrophosphate synthase
MVQAVMNSGDYANVPRRQLHEAVERVGALDRARARADEFARAARTALNDLPETDFLNSLAAIPTYVIDRDR